MAEIGLLIIDMQPTYLDNSRVRYQFQRDEGETAHQIKAIKHLCSQFYQNNFPIYIIETEGEGLTIPEILPIKYKMLAKKSISAFETTNLAEQLTGVDGIVLSGVNASVCVLETAKDAVEHFGEGRLVITSPILITDPRFFNIREKSLLEYKALGCRVLPVEEIESLVRYRQAG